MFDQFNRCITRFNLSMHLNTLLILTGLEGEHGVLDCGCMFAEIFGKYCLKIELKFFLVGSKKVEYPCRVP